MCDYFDDFEGEFIDEGFDDGEFDDGMEDSVDPEMDDLNQEDDQNDGFDVEDAFFTGGLFGFAYEEGKRERRKRKKDVWEDSSDID